MFYAGFDLLFSILFPILFHVLIFPMMVYRIIPKTTRNGMGNRMLNSISIPA